MRVPWCAVALLSLLVAGCGDDDDNTAGPDTSTGEVNEAIAGTMAGTTLKATALAAGGDGEAASFSLLTTGFSAFALITPTAAPPAPDVTGFLEPNLELFSRAGGDGCDCGLNSCNFDNCDNGFGHLINGTTSWTTTTLDCDYTVAGNQAGNTYSFSIFADLDFTATSIDGVLRTIGDFSTDAGGTVVTSSWDSEITFNNVTFAADGAANGGSISVAVTITSNGQTYSEFETFSFSPPAASNRGPRDWRADPGRFP